MVEVRRLGFEAEGEQRGCLLARVAKPSPSRPSSMGQEYNFASKVGTEAAGAQRELTVPLPFPFHHCPQSLSKMSPAACLDALEPLAIACRWCRCGLDGCAKRTRPSRCCWLQGGPFAAANEKLDTHGLGKHRIFDKKSCFPAILVSAEVTKIPICAPRMPAQAFSLP